MKVPDLTKMRVGRWVLIAAAILLTAANLLALIERADPPVTKGVLDRRPERAGAQRSRRRNRPPTRRPRPISPRPKIPVSNGSASGTCSRRRRRPRSSRRS